MKKYKYHFFLSYASPESGWDWNVVDNLYKELTRRDWRVYLAPRSNPPGENWADKLEGRLEESRVVVAILSERWHRSSYQIGEIGRATELALDNKKVAFASFNLYTRPGNCSGSYSVFSNFIASVFKLRSIPTLPDATMF